jgi:integrase
LRITLKTALRRGQVHRNVAALVDAPKVEREFAQPFSAVEAQTFLKASRGDRFGALYATALALGLRRG